MTIRSTVAAGVAVSIVGVVVAALPGAAVVALPACGFPSGTCHGDRVHAYTTDAGRPEPSCTTCLQGACCDDVGACEGDPACVESIKAAHRCVIEKGPGEESVCTTDLTPSARSLYDCMRNNCGGALGGSACNVSNCDVNAEAILVFHPQCDRCVTGACCEQINDCYGDRRCRLILECIVNECESTISTSMTSLGDVSEEAREKVRRDVCAGVELTDLTDSCLQKCIDDFAPRGAGGTADDRSARCLAFGVFTCSSGAKCGPQCAPQGDGSPRDGGAG